MIILSASAVLFVVSAIVLYALHARIAGSHPDLNVPSGRVLLEITPSTILARRLTRGQLDHPLASFYRMIWFAHMFAGLAFAISLLLSAFIAVP